MSLKIRNGDEITRQLGGKCSDPANLQIRELRKIRHGLPGRKRKKTRKCLIASCQTSVQADQIRSLLGRKRFRCADAPCFSSQPMQQLVLDLEALE